MKGALPHILEERTLQQEDTNLNKQDLLGFPTQPINHVYETKSAQKLQRTGFEELLDT